MRVEDLDASEPDRGKQGYGEIRRHLADSVPRGRAKTRLERAKIETKMDGRVRVLATVRAQGGPATLTAAFDGREFSKALDLPAGEASVELDFVLENPRLWSPEEPNLYEGELRLGEDCVSTYFGVRGDRGKVRAGEGLSLDLPQRPADLLKRRARPVL